MLPPSVRIERAAWEFVGGTFVPPAVSRGWCMQAVRLIVERALDLPPGGFYTRYGVARTSRSAGRTDWSWWAADIEASMKHLGFAVPAAAREPGCLVFSHEQAPPVGHVGILLTRDAMLEVVNPARRPASFARGDWCITPWRAWAPTLVAKIGD